MEIGLKDTLSSDGHQPQVGVDASINISNFRLNFTWFDNLVTGEENWVFT